MTYKHLKTIKTIASKAICMVLIVAIVFLAMPVSAVAYSADGPRSVTPQELASRTRALADHNANPISVASGYINVDGEDISISSVVANSRTNIVLVELNEYFALVDRNTNEAIVYDSFFTQLLIAQTYEDATRLATRVGAVSYVRAEGVVLLSFESICGTRVAYDMLSGEENLTVSRYIYLTTNETITLSHYQHPHDLREGSYLGFMQGWDIVESRFFFTTIKVIVAVAGVVTAIAGSVSAVAGAVDAIGGIGGNNNSTAHQSPVHITVSAANNGTVTGGGQANPGTYVTVMAWHFDGNMRFAGWYLNGVRRSNDPMFTIRATESIHLVANFVRHQPHTTAQPETPRPGNVSDDTAIMQPPQDIARPLEQNTNPALTPTPTPTPTQRGYNVVQASVNFASRGSVEVFAGGRWIPASSNDAFALGYAPRFRAVSTPGYVLSHWEIGGANLSDRNNTEVTFSFPGDGVDVVLRAIFVAR
jgi:hypothetical protein